ncbi:MAG: DNA adenine methylase [Candidatus Paceibacterales bacterium]
MRYFGAKYRIAPWIISHFPEHKIYVEPFGGGANVLLRKSRAYAEVYNDLDGDIVNVFKMFRDRPDELISKLKNTPFSRSEFDLSYEHCENDIERARRTICRSWMGFGTSALLADGKTGFRAFDGLSGNNSASQWKSYLEVLDGFKERLMGIVIENRDAFEVIAQQDSETTLFFLDPPYVHDTRKSGSYTHEMSNDQHQKLVELIQTLKGMVILCGYENDIYNQLNWNKEKTNTIAMSSDARTEILWISSNCLINQKHRIQ